MEIINTIIQEFTKKVVLEKEEIESLFFGGNGYNVYAKC
jgi:hypothetical protein